VQWNGTGARKRSNRVTAPKPDGTLYASSFPRKMQGGSGAIKRPREFQHNARQASNRAEKEKEESHPKLTIVRDSVPRARAFSRPRARPRRASRADAPNNAFAQCISPFAFLQLHEDEGAGRTFPWREAESHADQIKCDTAETRR